jgi:hypothetical protein
MPMAPLGPPPPYRPIKPVNRPAPRRAEMTPAPATPVNARLLGALGPPPPYRPVGQAAPVFERGPPPDLEPLRQPQPFRVPPPEPPVSVRTEADSAYPDGSDWSLSREADPEPQTTPPHEPTIRLETYPDVETGDQPFTLLSSAAAWPERGDVRDGSRFASPAMRRVIWLAGIAVTVILVGGALYVGRHSVMRTFRGVFPMLNVTGTRSAGEGAAGPRSP